jgi:hypothetical protein
VALTGLCDANLHSAWDTCLVLKAVGEDVGGAATELMKTITPARIESWNHSNPMDWANESFAIAEQAQTLYCIRQGASCDQPSGESEDRCCLCPDERPDHPRAVAEIRCQARAFARYRFGQVAPTAAPRPGPSPLAASSIHRDPTNNIKS